MSVPNCPAHAVIEDREGNEYQCLARYYGDGRILVAFEDMRLMVDPDLYYTQDPKRLFNDKTSRWTQYRVRSIILDSKFIRKNQ